MDALESICFYVCEPIPTRLMASMLSPTERLSSAVDLFGRHYFEYSVSLTGNSLPRKGRSLQSKPSALAEGERKEALVA